MCPFDVKPFKKTRWDGESCISPQLSHMEAQTAGGISFSPQQHCHHLVAVILAAIKMYLFELSHFLWSEQLQVVTKKDKHVDP